MTAAATDRRLDPVEQPDHLESEWIERSALEALHGAADAATAAALGLRCVPVADGMASVAATLPASAIVVNRIIGLGLERPLGAAAIEETARLYRGAGVARFFLHVHPDTEAGEAAEAFAANGLVPARPWQKFLRQQGAALPATAELEIRHVREPSEDFGRIACNAFDLGESAIRWLARLPLAKGWSVFIAYVDGKPAGTGALFVRDGIGWTDFGATAPEFRRRGVQRALLAHRLRLADEQGCVRVHTCTGAAVPGDPQHSYANILRCGFEETYQRANWAPPKA